MGTPQNQLSLSWCRHHNRQPDGRTFHLTQRCSKLHQYFVLDACRGSSGIPSEFDAPCPCSFALPSANNRGTMWVPRGPFRSKGLPRLPSSMPRNLSPLKGWIRFPNKGVLALTKIRSAILDLPRKNCELAKTPHLDRAISEHRAVGMGLYEWLAARQVPPLFHRSVLVRRSAAPRRSRHCHHSGHRISTHGRPRDSAG